MFKIYSRSSEYYGAKQQDHLLRSTKGQMVCDFLSCSIQKMSSWSLDKLKDQKPLWVGEQALNQSLDRLKWDGLP